eukprot:4949306-Amphidinium_carterae.1
MQQLSKMLRVSNRLSSRNRVFSAWRNCTTLSTRTRMVRTAPEQRDHSLRAILQTWCLSAVPSAELCARGEGGL